VSILREFGWHPAWRENSNAPDVRIATIDRIAGHMRRRSDDGEEAFGVNDNASRWLRVSGVVQRHGGRRVWLDGRQAPDGQHLSASLVVDSTI